MMKNYELTLEDLKHIYFGNEVVTKENMETLVDMLGDLYFVAGIDKALQIQIEKSSSPTYFYQFTYDKTQSLLKIWLHARLNGEFVIHIYWRRFYNTEFSFSLGACHADELFFLFRMHYLDGKNLYPKKDSGKYRISQQMVELWVNFAATG